MSSENTDKSLVNRIISSSFVYGIANMLPLGINFLLLPILTDYIYPENYGIVGISNTIVGIATLVFGFGLKGTIERYYFDYTNQKHEFKRYFGTIVIFFIINSGIYLVTLMLTGEYIFNIIFSDIDFDPYIKLSIYSSFFSASGELILGLYRVREQAIRFVTLQSSFTIINAALIIFYVVFKKQQAYGFIYGKYLSTLAYFVVIAILMKREFILTFDISKIKSSLKFALPLIPHNLSSWILNSFDRILIENMLNLKELGIYIIGYQIGSITGIVASTVNYALAPIYYRLLSDDLSSKENIIPKITKYYITLLSVISTGLMVVIKEIFVFAINPMYYPAIKIIPIIIISSMINGMYFTTVFQIIYMKKTYILPPLTIVTGGLNILLNILLIPSFGTMGSAYATLISFLALYLLTLFISQKLLFVNHDFRAISYLLIITVISFVLLNQIGSDINFLNFILKVLIFVIHLTSLFVFKIVDKATILSAIPKRNKTK